MNRNLLIVQNVLILIFFYQLIYVHRDLITQSINVFLINLKMMNVKSVNQDISYLLMAFNVTLKFQIVKFMLQYIVEVWQQKSLVLHVLMDIIWLLLLFVLKELFLNVLFMNNKLLKHVRYVMINIIQNWLELYVPLYTLK